MKVLTQAGRVFLVAALVATAVTVLRGLPSAPEEVAFCADPSAEAGLGVQWISQEAALEVLGSPGVAFVDARPEDEYHAGHVSGSLSIPVEAELGTDVLSLLRGSQTVVTYCDTSEGCACSTQLASLLVTEGFTDVRVLEGGLPDWIDNGFPAEAGVCHRCP